MVKKDEWFNTLSKKLVGNQKKLDTDNDGDIDEKDFKQLRETKK
jgi:hypothetical protein|tara:strand:- start:1792 stop:1923 length:132 start_codon:yes stop_codon:yes gene_type:complete